MMPERGRIGIFNRSYYEELLVVRVHPELLDHQKIPPAAARISGNAADQINNMEKYLSKMAS